MIEWMQRAVFEINKGVNKYPAEVKGADDRVGLEPGAQRVPFEPSNGPVGSRALPGTCCQRGPPRGAKYRASSSRLRAHLESGWHSAR
jgi:hypothetical protein